MQNKTTEKLKWNTKKFQMPQNKTGKGKQMQNRQ